MRTTVCESPLSANGPSQIPKLSQTQWSLFGRSKLETRAEQWEKRETMI